MVTIDDTSKAVHPAPSIPWSRANALQRMDGDEKLLLEILQIFLQEYPKQIAQMDRGLAELKPDLLEQAAHSLKGELGFLGVPEIEHLARSVHHVADPFPGVYPLRQDHVCPADVIEDFERAENGRK